MLGLEKLGLLGLFLGNLLAATVIPFSSDALYIAVLASVAVNCPQLSIVDLRVGVCNDRHILIVVERDYVFVRIRANRNGLRFVRDRRVASDVVTGSFHG